jgi:hypothetical protein
MQAKEEEEEAKMAVFFSSYGLQAIQPASQPAVLIAVFHSTATSDSIPEQRTT